MALNFPSSPSNGDTYFSNGIYYIYNSAKNVWKVADYTDNFTLANANTLENQAGSYYLNYNNFTNTPNLSGYATVTNLSNLTTQNVTEHSSALYFSNARARQAISVVGDGNYNSTTGQITINATDLSDYALKTYVTARLKTSIVAEDTNLYFTNARAVAAVTSTLSSYATQSYVTTAVANLVDSAPSTLDTLNELAAALGDDPNYATTTASLIGNASSQANVAYDQANVAANTFMIIAVSDEGTALTAGTDKLKFRAPFAMTLYQIPRASVNTASTSGVITVDINEDGTSILGANKLTIDANEKTSTTAATATTLADTSIADDAEITVDIDGAGTGATGLKVTLYYRRT